MEDMEPLLESESQATNLRRELNSRHLNMIVIGGTIGTGLFLGSGQSLALAGPGGSLAAFILIGMLVYSVVSNLGEMVCLLPIPGSFNTFGSRFVSPALGFSMGWNYWLQWSLSLPSELSALGIVLKYWTPNYSWLGPGLALGVLTVINCVAGVKGFGESEYIFSVVKVIAVVVFLVVGGLLDLGIPTGNVIGFKNWLKTPFKNGIAGLFDVFLIAFFAFGGTELIGSVAIMGLVIADDDSRLLDPNAHSSVALSPFTIIFSMAGIPGIDHAINLVVVSAILSAANSAMFAASRTLMSLAFLDQAPPIFARLYNGVPIFAIGLTTVLGSVAFIGSVLGDGVIFNFLLKLAGASGILTWMSISFIHLRFRRAYLAQGYDLEDLPYKSYLSPYSNYLSLFLGLVIIIGQTSLSLIHSEPLWMEFASSVSGLIFFTVLYFGYKIRHGSKLIPLLDCNFDISSADLK